MNLSDATGREWIERHVREALDEDLGSRGDITCQATVPDDLYGKAQLVCKAWGKLAGVDWARITGELTDPPVEWNFYVSDGDKVEPDQVLAEVTGPLRGILISERTALNGLIRLSGIATATAEAVELIRGKDAKVIDTRKTTPGWRMAEKYAVRCGGGENHRIGLYDEILIKENHIEAAGSVAKAILQAKDWVREKTEGDVPIEVEVESLDQLEEAISERPDRILLDNFTPEELETAVERAAFAATLEASGSITLDNINIIAATGVDRISLGALTHSAKPLDLSLRVRHTYRKPGNEIT